MDTSGCLGVKMPDGTMYPTNRRGEIHIDNPVHEAWLRNDPTLKDQVSEKTTSFKAEEKQCKCGFNAFSWQKICSKCNETI